MDRATARIVRALQKRLEALERIEVPLVPGGAGVGGSGASPEVAYFSAATTLTSDAGLQVDAANDLFIVADAGGIGNSNTTARLGFDSSGATDYAYFEDCFVGIGTTSPGRELDILGDMRVYEAANPVVLGINTYSDTTGQGSVLRFIKSHTDTALTNVTTLDTEKLGSIDWFGVDSTSNARRSAQILVSQDGSAGAAIVPTTFTFKTSDGASLNDAMVLDKNGYLGIGTTTPDYELDVDGVIGVDDNGGDPSTATNKATFYGKDVGGTTEAFAQDEAGNAAQLTAHPTGDLPFTPEPWEHIASYSNAYIGTRRLFRIERALRDLEASTGKQYIYDEAVPRRDWFEDQAKRPRDKRKPKPQWMRDFEEAQ